MCTFPSWIEKKDKKTGKVEIFYLTDKDAQALMDKEGHYLPQLYDYVGHGAIERFFNVRGRHKEGFDQPLPKEVAMAIRAGKMKKLMEASGEVTSVTINDKGLLHSEKDQPALIKEDGCFHYKDGKLHRVLKPAVHADPDEAFPDPDQDEYHLDGKIQPNFDKHLEACVKQGYVVIKK
jgi:hypothetical protein